MLSGKSGSYSYVHKNINTYHFESSSCNEWMFKRMFTYQGKRCMLPCTMYCLIYVWMHGPACDVFGDTAKIEFLKTLLIIGHPDEAKTFK